MGKWVFILFKIYEGEGTKVFAFALAGILLQTGLAIGYVAADALFLTHVGASQLSYIYFILPGIMLLITPAVSYLTEKLGVDRFQIVINIVLAIGGIGITFCVLAAESENTGSNWLYYVIKLYASLWFITCFTVYWNFVDAYFDILCAKRLFPVLSGATAIGSTLGGYLVTVFMDYELSVAMLFTVWSIFAFLAIFPVIKIGRSFSYIHAGDEEESFSFAKQMRHLRLAFRKSRYVFFLFCATFTAMFITNICEFQYMQVFEERHSSEAALANLFGTLFMTVNVFNVFVTFFVFNRLISTLGVRNTAVIQPAVYLLSFTIFVALYGQPDPMFYAAIFAFFAMQGFQTAIEDNNWNFMLNPIPQNVKSSVRAFAEGIIDPLGGAFAGLILILLNQYLDLSHLAVSTFGIGLAAFFLVVVLCTRYYYAGSMIQNLRNEWLDFSRSSSDIAGDLDREQKDLLVRLAQSESIEDAITACRILWVNDRHLASRKIMDILDRSPDRFHRKILGMLTRMLAKSDSEITCLVVGWLLDHDKLINSTTVQALGQSRMIHDEFVMNMVESFDPKERSAATTVLWNSWDVEKGFQAKGTVLRLLNGEENERIAGIQSIGSTGQSSYANFLVPYLKDSSPQVRRAAAVALCRLVDEDSTLFLPKIISIIRDGDTVIRNEGFQALSHIGDSECIPPLLAMADSFSHFEQRRIGQLITAIGLRSIPAVVSVVQDERYPYPGRSIAARAISWLAFPQLQALVPKLIAQEILRAYQILYFHTVLEEEKSSFSGLRVLSRFYRDEQLSTIEFVLKILALGGQIPSHEMIATSLRSASPKMRGDAIETLEQSVDRKTFNRLLPLVDGRPVMNIIQFYFKQFKTERLDVSQVVNYAWASNVDLERAASAQAKWDLIYADEDGGENEEYYKIFKSAVLDQICSGIGEAPPLVKDTVFSILFREEGKQVLDNVIEQIDLFSKSDFFTPINTRDLALIAEGAVYVEFDRDDRIFQQGDDSDSLYLIKEGRIRLENSEESKERSSGETFGEESLYGADAHRHNAVARPMSGYRLDRNFLLECAATSPWAAIGFLENAIGDPAVHGMASFCECSSESNDSTS